MRRDLVDCNAARRPGHPRRNLIQLLYSRPATDAELALAKQFFENASTDSDASGTWEQFTQAMLAASEFAFVD